MATIRKQTRTICTFLCWWFTFQPTIFQSFQDYSPFRGWSSIKQRIKCLAQYLNTVQPVRFELATFRSQVLTLYKLHQCASPFMHFNPFLVISRNCHQLSLLLMHFGGIYCNNMNPDQTAPLRSSLIRVHSVCSHYKISLERIWIYVTDVISRHFLDNFFLKNSRTKG